MSASRPTDMSVEDENVHRTISFCAGPPEFVDAVEASAKKRDPLQD